jgi:hypothetical protein
VAREDGKDLEDDEMATKFAVLKVCRYSNLYLSQRFIVSSCVNLYDMFVPALSVEEHGRWR